MLRFGWLALRQVQEALRCGRLEEAQRLLGDSLVQDHKKCWELKQELARALAERGARRLKHNDAPAAWNELFRAEQVGVTESAAVRLRQTLVRRGVADVRLLLDQGDPVRAAELIAQLRDKAARQGDLDTLEEAAKNWLLARAQADRGEFALAFNTLAQLRRLLPTSPGVEQFHASLTERHEECAELLLSLHEAARQEKWHEVLSLSEKILVLAPQHVDARRVRSRAWRAVEPATVASAPVPVQASRDAIVAAAGEQYLLWIDGVGGYLICLGNRITIGQATPENCVDLPVFAEVSRLHAALTRDTEGYVLEAHRPLEVNDRPRLKGLLRHGDRITLGSSCQLQFRQPVAVSASARLDLVSGHRMRLAVDGILLMADTLVLGPGGHVHVSLPEVAEPVILFRQQKGGLGVRHKGNLAVNGQPVHERASLEPGATVTGDEFSLTLESVHRESWLVNRGS